MSSDQDESSSASQSASDHEDRPMKKARYIWQIKGRYRLKQGRYRSCSENCDCKSGSSSLVVMRPDWPVHKWQTRQMAKAVVDNTINKVIENLGMVPLDHSEDGFFDDAYETFQSPRNPNNVEDAAVMMAIQSHGLQQKKCSCQNLPSKSSNAIQHTPFHLRSPYNTFQEGVSSSSTVSDDNIDVSQPSYFEHDFLAQAVAVAIQKKGLNALNTDHG